MEDVETLLKMSLVELEKVLSSKSVVGEPIKIGDATLIPLHSIGFAFGGAGGSGKGDVGGTSAGKGEGAGAGVGGGGGIKPVAMIVIDQSGVRLESVKGAAGSLLESIGTAIGKAVERKEKTA